VNTQSAGVRYYIQQLASQPLVMPPQLPWPSLAGDVVRAPQSIIAAEQQSSIKHQRVLGNLSVFPGGIWLTLVSTVQPPMARNAINSHTSTSHTGVSKQ
jgi:hypothetical protein